MCRLANITPCKNSCKCDTDSNHTTVQCPIVHHIVIDISIRVILDYRTTHAYKGDAPVMLDTLKEVADSLYENIGDTYFDSACLSREICNLISETGGTSYIKPKSTTIAKSKGSFI